MSKQAARVGDIHTCPMVSWLVPHVGGPILPPGASTVIIGGLPAATATNLCTCIGPPDSIISGSLNVLIKGKPAARMGDMTAHGGAITIGCPTVFIGDIQPSSSLTYLSDGSTNSSNVGDAPCPNLNALMIPPQTEEEKQEQARLLKELEQSIYQNIDSIPENERYNVINTLQNYQKTVDAADMARLSNAAYDTNNTETPLGFERADLSDIGLDEKFLNDQNSGFGASIFRSTTEGEPEYIVAYRGTEIISGEDWNTNFQQGMGMATEQYDRALIIGEKMDNYAGPGGFRTTGHSLGGGLASVTSATTGAPGTTFNSSGLHSNTTQGINGVSDIQRALNEQNVDAYYSSNDVLNLAQDNRGKILTALGGIGGYILGGVPGGILGGGAGYGISETTDVLPEAYGNRIEMDGAGFHGIQDVIDFLDAKALEDLNKLKDYFGCP